MSEARRAVEIRALSGARALPPLILVLFHFCEGHGYRGLSWFDLIAAKGYLWVEFFFALSGFILLHVYGPRLREVLRARGYFSFLRARLVRLYPLHLFMIFAILGQLIVFDRLAEMGGYISIFHQPYHPHLTLATFIANLFLVQAWNLFPYLSWNGVAWFVSVEFFLCLLFPVFLFAANKGGIARGVVLVAIGVGGLVALNLTSKHGLDLTFHDGIWRGMAAFTVGVGLESLFRSARDRALQVPAIVHSLFQAVVVAWLLYAIWFTGWSHTHRDIWSVLPMFALVFALAFDRGVVAGAMGSRVLRRLGDWSYAIFIGQTFWLQFIRFAEQRILPAPDRVIFGHRWAELFWWPEPILLVAICIAWGACLTALIERPARDALNRLLPVSAAPRAATSS